MLCTKPTSVPTLSRISSGQAKRIFQLENTLFEAAQAAEPPSGEPPAPETIEVDKAEYRRLLDCRSIVEAGLAKLGSDEEDN